MQYRTKIVVGDIVPALIDHYIEDLEVAKIEFEEPATVVGKSLHLFKCLVPIRWMPERILVRMPDGSLKPYKFFRLFHG